MAGPARPAVALGLGALAAAPLLFLVDGLGAGGTKLLRWLATWGTPIDFALAALACFAAARLRPHNRAWLWFGLGCSLWTGANLYYALVVYPDALPLPSPADIGYFSFPPVVSVGFVFAASDRLPRMLRAVVLDALIVALCVGAVAAGVIFEAVDESTHNFGVVLTSLVYPIEDVAVIGVLAGIGMLLGWRFERRMVVLGLGLLSITAADLIVATRVLNGDPVGGAWSNLGWTLGVGLLAAAGWTTRPGQHAFRPRHVTYVGLPVVAAAVALAVLAAALVFHLSPVASVLAIAALAIACIRMHLSFAEVRELADSHRLALIDELTNLPNRRRLMRDLTQACGDDTPRLLALYDLDGFKHFNDTHGHSEGDRLLIALAARLAASVAPSGTAYRLGGDEFCVLAPADAEGHAAVHAAGAALADHGDAWRVTATYGVVEVPTEVSTVSDAMRTADRRMYAEKDRRPVAARQQVRDVLLSALGEQQPLLHAHTVDVTQLAAEVARSLGMTPSEIDEVVRAAELHDVGKLAIPPSVLEKPGPLDEDEWELMHQHTLIGERMLTAAASLRPIAPLVRSSHERWDGGGYPDGLRGEQIPLGARIVAVCDAYDAMVADRPYRTGMPPSDALAEIQRCAGSQFDPAVVEVFVRVTQAREPAASR